MKMSEIVAQYYTHRYPGNEPDARQSLLWLLSEVGELVEAWADEQGEMPYTEQYVFTSAILVGKMAEDIVTADREWIRNNDRAKAHNLGHEIGDVLMMLTRFSVAAGVGDPQDAMLAKMATKGFTPDEPD